MVALWLLISIIVACKTGSWTWGLVTALVLFFISYQIEKYGKGA